MTSKKKTILSLFAFLALTVTTHTDPSPVQPAAPNAKWLVHVDVKSLRTSKLGETLTNAFVHPGKGKATVTLNIGAPIGKLTIDVGALLNTITYVTAYGNDFGANSNAVLMNFDYF